MESGGSSSLKKKSLLLCFTSRHHSLFDRGQGYFIFFPDYVQLFVGHYFTNVGEVVLKRFEGDWGQLLLFYKHSLLLLSCSSAATTYYLTRDRVSSYFFQIMFNLFFIFSFYNVGEVVLKRFEGD